MALLAAFLWGGNSVFIKIGLGGMPPIALAVARFVLGMVVVLGAALWAGIPLSVPRRAWRGLTGLGILFIGQIMLLNFGTDFTSASRSTVVINAYPFFTALFAHLFIPGDRFLAI